MRAVFFDIDNTLVDRAATYERYAADLVRRSRAAFAPLDEAAAVRALVEIDDNGYRERDEFCAEIASRFSGLRMTPAQVWDDFAAGLVRAVEPEPLVIAMIERLRGSGVLLGVISNGDGRRQRAKLERARLAALFPGERLLISGELGIEKPDRRIFERALRSAGLDESPSEALYVGDNPPVDIAGAHGAGLQSCWVSRGREYPADLPPPDRIIERVEQLV